jgi:ribonuclease HI
VWHDGEPQAHGTGAHRPKEGELQQSARRRVHGRWLPAEPGRRGWAAVIYDGPEPTEASGFERHTTNNQMDLRAAIEGLKQLEAPRKVRLFSDSAYLINCMIDGWHFKWERNGWKSSKKKPVENADLWQELLDLVRRHDVKWVKIEGHAGVAANERCHALVRLAIHQRGR